MDMVKKLTKAHRNDVWQDSELLEGPHVLPGSAQAWLNFVGDANAAMFSDDLVDLLDKGS